jgi:hypothetical protein
MTLFEVEREVLGSTFSPRAVAELEQTVRKLPSIVARDEAGQDEDDKISVTPDRQFCG